jgi:nicotinamide-nucleotide adenylyltransferase
MILLFAKELEQAEAGILNNVAVAAIDEPTFVGKSRVLRTVIEQRLSSTTNTNGGQPSFHLYFLLGWDTLIRLFDPRFYHDDSVKMNRALRRFFADKQDNGDASRVVCARRPSCSSTKEENESNEDIETERRFMQSDDVKEYVVSGKIVMIDLPADVRGISSTKVRNTIKGPGNGAQIDQDNPLGDLVSTKVVKYISEERLYSVNG